MDIEGAAVSDEAAGYRFGSGGDDRRLAAIDVGSNSIKMTIARLEPTGEIDEIAWAVETVRLGAGLDASGRLADDRMEAALATLARFAATARDHGAARIVAVATEATRAAANGAEFLDRVGRETGIELRIVDGAGEADLTFRGLAATADIAGDVVVADVGGGSTELIVAADAQVRGSRSLPLGSGRLTDRLVASDPPTGAELDACRQTAADLLAGLDPALPMPTGAAVRLIVVGGTGEYLGRLVPDQRRIVPDAVDAVLDRLSQVPSRELAERLSVAEARARVLPAGIAIVAAVADRIAPGRIEAARSGLRRGLLIDEFARSPVEPNRPRAPVAAVGTAER